MRLFLAYAHEVGVLVDVSLKVTDSGAAPRVSPSGINEDTGAMQVFVVALMFIQ